MPDQPSRPDRWPTYLREYHAQHAGITERLLQRCEPNPYAWLLEGITVTGANVLDLACGSAPTFPHLPGARYLGVDASLQELEVAQALGRGPVVLGNAVTLPLPDSWADVVVCSMALQVLTPLPNVLAEVRRVLRPSGILVALIPVSRPLTFADRRRYARLLWTLRRPRLGYANRGLSRVLRRDGWRITSQDSLRAAYPVVHPSDRRLLVDALYLPKVPEARSTAAAAIAMSWTGSTLGIPLERLVARLK